MYIQLKFKMFEEKREWHLLLALGRREYSSRLVSTRDGQTGRRARPRAR
jgi:hypothetical protein